MNSGMYVVLPGMLIQKTKSRGCTRRVTEGIAQVNNLRSQVILLTIGRRRGGRYYVQIR
jgi:hypothetical protein